MDSSQKNVQPQPLTNKQKEYIQKHLGVIVCSNCGNNFFNTFGLQFKNFNGVRLPIMSSTCGKCQQKKHNQ